MAAAGAKGLQAYLITPSTPGKHPLVLMTHGTEYSNGQNHEIGPGILQPQALWFARRGWDVAIIIRRGYGDSGGKMDKANYGCSEANFNNIAVQDASDLLATYQYFQGWPDIDTSNIIAVGNSTGGFAVVSFGAKEPPPGLKAVINFSGGWHSLFFAGSCSKSGIVPAFRDLGSESTIPMLWIYADNDGLFGPKYVAQIYQAFTGAGGRAELATVKHSGDNGHYLFSESQELWGPIVQRYLAQQDLPSTPLYPDPISPKVKLPMGFSSDQQDAFSRFLKLGPCKAFAVGPNGAWGYSSGKLTPKLASDAAMDNCRSSSCVIIATDPK